MQFNELYEKGLDRILNPAVSASDLSENTIKTEIEEYVFTQDIIANLFNILTNIKTNQGSHVGIWINGYYGSGKSHFLKYASYCLSPKYAEKAFNRLIEAAEGIMKKDTLALEQAGVSLSELKALKSWYSTNAKIEMVMFNIGDVHDANADTATTFTTIFWNQFNAKRGYNSFNLALAQHLEKALDDAGKFEEFKEYVWNKGFDWERNIARFAGGRLDMALEMAKEVDKDLAIDVIRQNILNNQVNVSVESFAAEVKEYLDKKQDRNYRILFFVDEVSQFIGAHRNLLLQLQSLVERLHDVCESKVWIACTSQQTLDEVVTGINGGATNPNEEIGKILGRFEVRASLQGTSPEYITQRRILEKKGEAEIELSKIFDRDKAKLDAQFILPTTYQGYRNKEDFIAFYPFVPYQFQLIMKVLDSFVNMNYVDKQVKGNERSLLNITFSIAKNTAKWKVGQFIPFDMFYGPMFKGSMQHFGQRAMDNARSAVALIQDNEKKDFYQRVVDVLFMICNLSEVDKQSFSATIDNVVTLLMTEVDANKAAIKDRVGGVLSYLIEKSVIHKVKTVNGSEIYEFYTQEESQVAELIKNQTVDSNTYSEELYKIIYNHFGFSNKETYATRSFNVGINVDGRSCLSNSNTADVIVDFLTTSDIDSPEQFAFGNTNNHLVFFLYPQFFENADLRQNFLDYCKIQRFAQQPAISEERQKTKRMFQERAKDMYEKEIKPMLQHILDTCPVISGQNVLTPGQTGNFRKQERYKNSLTIHLGNLYEFAQVVNTPETPKTQSDLSGKILSPIEPRLMETPLSTAEQKVKEYLDRQLHDATVADVIHNFAKVPYGWSDLASVYTLNELVRRHLYRYNYNNNPNVTREETARNIIRESNKFTVEKAKAIPQDTLNKFIESWKHIFNVLTVPGGNDSTELYRNCKEADTSALNTLLQNYGALAKELGSCPFVGVIEQAIDLMEDWRKIRDPKEFFDTIIASRDSAAGLFDQCKSINTFANEQYDKYEETINFISDNRDNFSFLAPDQQPAVESIIAIEKDMEPWNNMPAYLKLMRSLNVQLQERRRILVEKITSKFNKIFDELEEYAKSVNVPLDKFANRNTTISNKTNTNNFYALQAAVQDDSFFETQMRAINAAVRPTPSTNNKPTGSDPAPAVRTKKVIFLNTSTTNPLRTEADVDSYLKRLKEEIMQHIGGNDDIIIK